MFKYFDVHTHVQFTAFKDDHKEVIERALAAGVWMVNVGTQKDTSRSAVEIAHQYKEGVYATVGIHPIHTSKSFHDEEELGAAPQERGEPRSANMAEREDFDYDYYKKLALDPKVVATGECGLDYYRGTGDMGQETRGRQKEVFLKQIELAKEIRKPLMIHCRSGAPERASPQDEAGRDAFKDLIDILKPNTYNLKPSVVHFFTGSKDDAERLLDLGFSFTFGGVITFTRDYDEVIKMIPVDRILSETDAPYVAPVPYRGKRNEPAYVVEVVKKLAEIKGVSAEEMAERIIKNTRKILVHISCQSIR